MWSCCRMIFKNRYYAGDLISLNKIFILFSVFYFVDFVLTLIFFQYEANPLVIHAGRTGFFLIRVIAYILLYYLLFLFGLIYNPTKKSFRNTLKIMKIALVFITIVYLILFFMWMLFFIQVIF